MAPSLPTLGLCGLALTVGLSGLCFRELGILLWRRGRDLPGAWKPLRRTRHFWRLRFLRQRYYALSSLSILGLGTFQIPFLMTADHPELLRPVLLGFSGFVVLAAYADLLFGQREAFRRQLLAERERRRVARRIHGTAGTA